MRRTIHLGFLLMTLSLQLSAQITSFQSGDWRTPSTWVGGVVPTSGQVIIADGHTVTLDNASTYTISDLQVGQGVGTATFVFGDGTAATANSLSITNSLVIQTSSIFRVNNNDGNTHLLTVNGDIVNNGGTFDLENGTGLVNTTMSNSATAVLSGSTMIFNDLTINGGQAAILIATIDVNGNFSADVSGTDITTSSNHTFAGNFSLTNSATVTATSSNITFDGTSAQALSFSGGNASFNNVVFDNSNKTVTGNLISDGTFEITNDAIWTNSGGDHQIDVFEVKNPTGVAITGGTVTFNGGEIRFGDNANSDGTITLGTGTAVTFNGACSIQRDDQLTVDGDVEITAIGYLVLNGIDSPAPAGQSDAELNVTGSRTLTIRDNGDLFVRGYDNFPTGFTNYVLEKNSLVRYDANFNQLVMSENSANTTISFGRLYLSQADASVERTRQLFTGDDDLLVGGQFDLVNGVRFFVSHTATLTFNEDMYMDPGTTAGDPAFDAQSATIILDANINQTVDGPVDGNYDVDQWQITNTSTPTAIRRVNIDDNISVDAAFSVTNPNGSSANTLIVDIDDNQIFGEVGSSETFTLGANCLIFTSTDDADGFAEGFGDTSPADVINMDMSSTVRFDRAGNQIIPNFNGGTFGSIEFAGNGNKYVIGNLDINGNVTRVGGSPVFRFGTSFFGAPFNSEFAFGFSHTVAGDWNMATAYTGDDESNSSGSVPFGGEVDPVITFDGTDQIISSSDFNDVVFSGSGTKTITGTLLIDEDLTINTGVTVDAGAEAIDIAGNWTENGTGVFTQSGSTTDFNSDGPAQFITTNSGSYFNRVTVTNNSPLNLNSTVQINNDLSIETGSVVYIEGQTLRIGRDLWVNTGAQIHYSNPMTSIIVFDGNTEQDIRNINAAQNFPTVRFEGVGNKELVNNIMTVEGDLTIANESTFQGNSFEINFEGSNWTNNGNFNHNNSVNFVNAGGTTTVSTSTFHDIEIGRNDGSVITAVVLGGNISLNGEMNIFANTTLDVSSSNFAISVEEDWNNYGAFNARAGTVTFTGGESDFRSFSLTLANSGSQANKAFYNLNVNNNPGSRFDVEQEGVVLNDQIDVLNNLNIVTGIFRLVEDASGADPGPALLNVGGSLINTGNGFEFRQENARITLNGTSGTHNINLGGDQIRDFEINAPGATYQLTGDFLIRDDTDNAFEMTAGTLDLNSNILTVNRGGLDMTGGTLIVDEGSSLLLNDLATNPDFNKTGGSLQIIGAAGTPATLSAVDAGGFTFTQTSGDFQAQNYTIANTTADGLRIEGGTIDTGNTGNDFSNGTFTTGTGTAYLTLANIAIGTHSASNVIFNAGPTNNVAIDLANQPVSGSIEFVIAGGSLAGAQDELDNPDGGATTGFIRWNEDTGLTWTGGTSSAWNLAANWANGSGDPDGIPDADDIIYIESGTPNDPIIANGESFSVARVTIRNTGNLTFQGNGELSVGGNFTMFSGCTVDMTNNSNSRLNIAGAWSNAGTFNEGGATITFNGTSGTHSITTGGSGDPFNNLTIDGDGATYTLGSVITVANSFKLTDGMFDASSGFDLFINKDWTVSGGIFEPGQGRVRFNGTSGTQSISGGTLWDVNFEGAAAKSIDGNIAIADDVIFSAGGGLVAGNDRTIFVGGDWDLDVTNGFTPGTGTVIFNGTAGQTFESDLSHPLTFNNVILQNVGTKSFRHTNTVNGDFSIISENTFVDLRAGSTLTVTGTLTQTGGNFRIWNSNFPTAGAYSLTGGEVDFLQDGTIAIPGGITFNDLEIRALTNTATTATLGGDITVNDDINFSYGQVTFDANGHTITLGNRIFLSNDETLIWGVGGTLIHTGAAWYMDADFNTTTRAFENLTLGGTSLKRPNSDIAVGGNLTVLDGVELEQLTRAITNDGDGAFVMEQNTILDNRVVGLGLPTGFASYTLHETSRVDLQASGNQTLFTNSGTLEYGRLRLFSTGTITMDGNLTVHGDFDMNTSPTLNDGGFNINLNGAFNDIQDYTPGASTTVTFGRSGDQLIVDYDGSGQDLELRNVIFSGSGIKTLVPNAADEVTDIDGTVTINNGVTVTTSRGIDFSGTNWTNNGTFNLTVTTRPFVFSGADTNVDPGTNDIAAMTVANTLGTVTVENNGLDLGTGPFVINANATIDFGSLTHQMASSSFSIDAAGSWILTGSTLDFDRNTTQFLPIIDQGNANITGIPSIITSTAGAKILTGNTVVNDLTIGSNTDLEVDFTNNYQLTIHGNWGNNGGDFIEREGTVIFQSDDTNAKTINPNGEDFATVVFQGSAVRTYTLQSNMQIEGNTSGAGLTLTSATLDLNGHTLRLGDNDTGDPDAELNIIGNNGTLEVDAGATLQFDTNDDGGDVANTEIGGNLDVQNGGVLNIVGSGTDLATVTRSAGGNRIDINVESGGEIGVRYYSIQYLTDEGLEVEDGATINATNNFSDGSFSNLATDAGNGTGNDTNPVAGNRYLTIESNAAMTISNVTFNFSGTPTVGSHYNVTRSNAAGNNTIDFDNTSGPLGRVGAVYEEDGAGGAPAETTGQLTWEVPNDTQWTGAASTAWNNTNNWDNGVPSIASNDREAIINLGSPFNPNIDAAVGTVNISGLIINDGVLKVINSGILDLNGDLTLGDGTGGALIMDNSSTLTVDGSWTTSANAIFDHGDGTVTFDATSGISVSISPGNQSFYNLSFSSAVSAGEFNIVSSTLDVDGSLTIANSANVIPATNGYNYSIAGDITATDGDFNTNIDGEIILDGANQTLTNMTFDELTASGTGTKTTSGTTTVNDNFIVEPGVTVSGGGNITFRGDVTIDGTFNGVSSQTYTFTGDDWIAAPGSYTGQGTVEFSRIAGTQYIRQSTAGNNPVEFNHLTLNGSAQIQLGRLIGGNQDDGNIDLTGNLTVNNTINVLDVNGYLIDNTSGTGTFTLADGEYIRVEGTDNFPANFATYDLADGSFTLYYGTVNQIVRGVSYGNLYFLNSNTKTLSGNIDVDGTLLFQNSTLDVSASNFSINIAGRWDNEYGNADGSFLARAGTVTFDGAADQILDIGETGTQSFNDVLINKSGGSVELIRNNLTIAGNLNVFNGRFDINSLDASIGGNMGASGTGTYASNGAGLYLLNATSGTPTIGVNGSTINGSIEINAPGRTYELVDNLTLLANFTLTAGILDVNGQTMNLGDFEDVVDIFGTLNVSTTSKPGGTLALGNDVQLVVQPGGTINIIGTSSQPASVTSTGTSDYIFSVTGTGGNPGNIAARYYVIEYMGVDGIFVNSNTSIDATNNFSDGTFQNGFSGGKYLRIENTQDLSGSNRIENVVFDDNPGGGATNIFKSTAVSGNIEVYNYTGGFSGENFDEDPNSLITWLNPPTVTWTGTVSSDWFTGGNWDSGVVPTSTQNVIIPQVLNEPVITDNASVALANNLTLEVNAVLEINTSDTDIDLQIAGNLVYEASARFESSGSDDDIEISGSWIRLSTALFTTGTSQVTFNSPDGTETIDNNDGFYDLIVNVIGTVTLSTDLSVTNDLTVSGGTLDLASADLIVGGDFLNSSIITTQNQTVSLIPSNTNTPKIFNPGTSEFYNLTIGESLGNNVEYDLSNDLTVNHDFNLIIGTLDPNTQSLNFGNNDAIQDDVNIAGTILVSSSETMALGDDAVVLVQNGGDLRFNGSTSNSATLTRRASGAYNLTVQFGGTFEATNFVFEHMADEGVWFQTGSTLIGIANGTFTNGGQATQYLRLSNSFASDITASNLTFNTGPASNVRRNEAAGNNIILEDASGILAGSSFELDDLDPATGEVRWTYTNPLRVWTGGTSTQWDLNSNWEDALGVSPATFPTSVNTVQIPDVSAGSNRYPVVDATSGNESANDITIFPNAQLTIDDGQTLSVTESVSNSGTITIPGTTTGNLSIGDSWTNNGTFNPGHSTVTLTSDTDVTVSGGMSFWNFTINGSAPTIIFSSSDALDVDNDFTITQGIYQVTDPTHHLTIGNDLVVDDANASFVNNLSTTTFDGTNQSIGSLTESSTITFNDVVLAGSGTKTVQDALDINGDLSIGIGTTLALVNENIFFAGSSFDVDGNLDVSGGTSSVTFDGAQIQVITGSAGNVEFDNLAINNTAAGNSDIQWNIGVSVNSNANFITGIAQSTGSNPLTFLDNASVSYDGVLESTPSGISSDGNSYAVGPVVKVGDEDFIFPVGEGSRHARIGISGITGSTAADRYSAEYFFGDQGSTEDTKNGSIVRVSILEYWDLSNLNGHSGQPQVTLFWDATSEVTHPGSLTVAHYNGSSWDDEGNGGTSGSATAGSITSANNFTSFSPITLATTNDALNPLPVDLVSFEANLANEEVVLTWQTASELNNDRFEIERSLDGETFEYIGVVAGNGTQNIVADYQFVDQSPTRGVSFYRLKQVDFDGAFEYSQVISVNNNLFGPGLAFTLFPNPTSQHNINLQVSTEDLVTPVELTIFDIMGNQVHNEGIQVSAGFSTFLVQTNTQLDAGVYQVVLQQSNSQLVRRLIIK